ncbi:MAG: TetR/AcrR family transcriptional regulator [Sneathiella sp.]
MSDLKGDRKKEMQAYKRQKILDAAATLFKENGIEGTTMRAIAKAAGYSTGAPYAYYQSKEDIYAELLSISLANLSKTVKAASLAPSTKTVKIRTIFTTFFSYYHDHAEELQLGLYLFSSGEVKKRGFSKDTNDQLNGKLLGLLGFMANSLHELGKIEAKYAQTETLDAITFFIGTLMLGATGRLSTFGASQQEMIDRYVNQMLKRVSE